MPKMLQLTDEDFNRILASLQGSTMYYHNNCGNVRSASIEKEIMALEELQEYLRKVQKGDYEKQTRTIREDQKDLHN